MDISSPPEDGGGGIDLKKNEGMIVVAACLWGMIGLFVRGLDEAGFHSMQIVAFRAVVSLAALFLLLLCTDRRKLRLHWRDCWMFIGSGIVSFVLFNYCFFSAIQLNGLTTAVILLYTAPAFVTVMSARLFGEKLTGRKLLALILTLAGCALATGALQGGGPRFSAAGLAFGLASGFGYALYSIFSKYALRRYAPQTVIFYTFAFASLGAVPLAEDGLMAFAGHFDTVMQVLAIGLISSVAPFLLYTKGLARVEASRASILATFEPIVGASIGLFVFGEPLTVSRGVGILLTIAALVMLHLRKRPRGEIRSF